MPLILYSDSSPNGFKITIALEELGLPYTLKHVQIDHGEHRQAEFLKLNPHGRIPVLVDNECDITLFESAAILLYLAQKSGRLLPEHPGEHWAAITWLQFHAASMGPILGQRVHFELFAEQTCPEAITRYRRLSEELFSTLDQRLADHPWLAGNSYSIADIATFGWTHILRIIDFDFSQYPHLTAWHDRVTQRPAVQRGIRLPAPATGP
ncbi:glutathione S-transferase family protein [Pseudomonas rubra]|uniref:Glutathione S-transferase family protein n=1 Tax=Pseudomonas rubra TaxID=2942627 RepID=A0ABT5P4A5_9PSED|nr:glutathione S-transferase family protein [Pseudomonas rubra]MDD1013115.1 glutathione S-transferase family protein [Pseudomonas rubra]MDD1036915.1 glutathione S-transferase family protein [Pseudomonas rubra]MDD1154491.1 glutathione S-transferase family protein [Pseudomonas rubra]